VKDRSEIWNHFGIDSSYHFRDKSDGYDVNDIANSVEEEKAMSVGVNVSKLWGEDIISDAYGVSQSNHVISVVSTERHAETNELLGVYINDTGRGDENDAGRYLSVGEFVIMYRFKCLCVG